MDLVNLSMDLGALLTWSSDLSFQYRPLSLAAFLEATADILAEKHALSIDLRNLGDN